MPYKKKLSDLKVWRVKYNYVIKCNQVTNNFNFGNSRSNGYLFSHRTLLSGSFSISPLRVYTESI